MIDLVNLKILAMSATPGEWTHKRFGVIVGGPFRQYTNGQTQSQLASFSVTYSEDCNAPERQIQNANFCAAASPKVILEIINLIERQEKELKDTQATVLAMAEAIGSIHGALGLDPEDSGGAEPIIEKIEEMQALMVKLGTRCGHPMAPIQPAGPQLCPITRRKFWGNIDHPTLGYVATYGGPYDTYTIPALDEDDELLCERFSQDAGQWVEGGVPAGWYSFEQPEDAAQPAPAPSTLPPMPAPMYKHQTLGGMFDRMQMHCYAAKHAEGLARLYDEVVAAKAAPDDRNRGLEELRKLPPQPADPLHDALDSALKGLGQ